MAEIIILNKARKQKAKAEKKSRAKENRQRHGLTKGQKLQDKTQKDQTNNKLDGLRLYTPENKRNSSYSGQSRPTQ